MYAKGLYRDYIHVGYNDSRVFMYHIDLGTGKRTFGGRITRDYNLIIQGDLNKVERMKKSAQVELLRE